MPYNREFIDVVKATLYKMGKEINSYTRKIIIYTWYKVNKGINGKYD